MKEEYKKYIESETEVNNQTIYIKKLGIILGTIVCIICFAFLGIAAYMILQ